MDTTPTPDDAAAASTDDGVDTPDRMHTAAQARAMLTRAGHEPAQVDALLEAAGNGGRWTEFTDARVTSMLDTLAGVHDTTLDADGFYPRDQALITWIRHHAPDQATGLDDDQTLALARRTELDHLEHPEDADHATNPTADAAAAPDEAVDGSTEGDGVEGVDRDPFTQRDTTHAIPFQVDPVRQEEIAAEAADEESRWYWNAKGVDPDEVVGYYTDEELTEDVDRYDRLADEWPGSSVDAADEL